jgi:pseudouridine synthase
MVEPDRDRVEVRGRPLPGRTALAYYVLHKPVGVISTLSDPEGRRTLREFMPPGAHVFPVGRLDADTSGLLILTSDGELAHHLMHPRYGVSKLYRVHTDRAPSAEMQRRLREGIEFEPGVRSAPARVRLRDADAGECVIEIELHEGRYRQVRRMCEAAGLRVLRLHRWGYGPLRLAGVARGLWRELSDEEVRRLRSASARPHARPAGAGASRPPRGGARRNRTDAPAWSGERRERAESPRAPRGGPRRSRMESPAWSGERRERAESPRAPRGGPRRNRTDAPAWGGERRTRPQPPARPPGGPRRGRHDAWPPRDGARGGRPGSPEPGRRGPRRRFESPEAPRADRRDAPFERQRRGPSAFGPRSGSRRPGGRPSGRPGGGRPRGPSPRRSFDR